MTQYAAYLGIDWADKKHDVCLSVVGTGKRERSVIEHKPAALRAWAEKLRERFGGSPVAVCLELSQGPIVSALLEHDFFVLFPVQPATLARYRNAFTTSRAKDDPTDAEFALELLLRHPEKLSPLEPESVPMRSLRRLVEARRCQRPILRRQRLVACAERVRESAPLAGSSTGAMQGYHSLAVLRPRRSHDIDAHGTPAWLLSGRAGTSNRLSRHS